MDKVKDKLTFSKMEIIFIVVLVALVIIAGITVFSFTTKKQNIANFIEDTESLIGPAKNAHAAFTMSTEDKYKEYVVKSEDGKTEAICFTINGLKENGFLTREYTNWDGYIVVEQTEKHDFYHTIWVTNKKYVIDGYEAKKIKDLTTDDGITSYNKEQFTNKVKTSFTGTSGSKGGSGSTDGKTLLKYEGKCVNEKVE